MQKKSVVQIRPLVGPKGVEGQLPGGFLGGHSHQHWVPTRPRHPRQGKGPLLAQQAISQGHQPSNNKYPGTRICEAKKSQ